MEPWKRKRAAEDLVPESSPGIDRDAELEFLMRYFGNEVLGLTYFYFKDRQMAEDAAQEVFLRVYDKLDEFRGESSYHTWIYRITVNLCKDRLRSWSYRNIIFLDHNPATLKENDTEDTALEHIEADEILHAVLELPNKYREAVALKYYANMTIHEIAEACNLQESNVRVRLHRAYKMLKKKFKREDVE